MPAPDLERPIERRFLPAEQARARLTGARIHDGSAADDRLVRCAAVASGGSLAALQTYLSMFKIDWRDVVFAGEYDPGAEGRLVRVRDLDGPIGPDV